jgi:hypothetical protein
MPAASSTSGTPIAAFPVDPKTGTPSGEAIYDFLMAKIEPDLVSAAIPTLNAKYKNETPDQRKARGERYKTAFERYDTAYRAYMDGMKAGVTQFQHQALRSVESDDRTQEQANLESLESSMSSL